MIKQRKGESDTRSPAKKWGGGPNFINSSVHMKLAKQCYFCAANVQIMDFKDAQFLWKFLTPQAQIAKRRKTGTCSLHQRQLAETIKRARFLGLVPFTTK